MEPDTNVTLDELFRHHPPTDAQIPKYQAIRDAARAFAQVLDETCPPSADRTVAMRKLQDCVMTANRAIALGGRSYR
jgi:hypothetical protein